MENQPADKTALLSEYDALRQEILICSQYTHQSITLGFALAAAVSATVALTNNTVLIEKISLLTLCVVIYHFLIRLQVYRRKKMNRIGRYIEHVIEKQLPSMGWESSWCREAHAGHSEETSWLENGPLLLLQLYCFLTAMFYVYKLEIPGQHKTLFLLVMFSLLVFLIVKECLLLKSAKDVQGYKKEFCDWLSAGSRIEVGEKEANKI